MKPDSTVVQSRGLAAGNAESVSAVWLATAVMMVAARWRLVTSYTPLPLPCRLLAPWQDIAVAAVCALAFTAALALSRGSRTSRIIVATAWVAAIASATYAVLNSMAFPYTRAPLTYRLIEMSDHFTGIGASLHEEVTAVRLAKLALTPVAVIVIARAVMRLAPRGLAIVSRASYFLVWACLIASYCITARAYLDRYAPYQPAMTNPEVAFARLSLESPHLPHGGPVLAEYYDDFRPLAASTTPASASGPLWGAPAQRRRPMNVLLVVMESVGTRDLQLYGAPYPDSPEMVRLARKGLIFDHFFVEQGSTSTAMAALLCSVYPYPDWLTIVRAKPSLEVASISSVLAKRGYRTAFLHDGQLEFDHQGEFLDHHGFSEVRGTSRDSAQAIDGTLLPEAVDWIRQQSTKPFFLTIWTNDTHHPYTAPASTDYGVRDKSLNRYLNAVHESDTLVGALADQLQEMGLTDDTLLVVTGDHGEAFREHLQAIHGFTVYDEEMRVPLLIVNPRLFPTARKVSTVGQHVDLPVTLLSILGYPAPDHWQGRNLFAQPRHGRAYFFSSTGSFTWGLLEGNLKYIYDSDDDRFEIYNLAVDPHERNDLAGDPVYASGAVQAGARLRAWYDFQNRFLKRLGGGDGTAPAAERARADAAAGG